MKNDNTQKKKSTNYETFYHQSPSELRKLKYEMLY